MVRLRDGAPRGLRWGLLSLATVFALVAVSSDDSDARRRKRATTSSSSSYSPAYAAIVVDANSGNVMHSANADALRHPASLTKIMTLYMLFERLEAGKVKLDTPFKVSEHAADQSPTKLGLKEGTTIQVEDAIKGMVTRSANDAAVVVAENLAGSEEEFARQMTRKAHALGMTRTVYRNASGLPDDEQVTTARDQAILGRSIQERFPRYYKYFQTRSFTFRGQSIGNHNRLLGRVEGVDGIKTGYTHASGFNLVTSVHRDGRYVVAVVLGGSSAGSRDARMRDLLDQYVDDASTKRTAPVIAEAAPAKPEGGKDPQRFNLASTTSTPAQLDPPASTAAAPRVTPGSTDPIRPVMVKTLNVRPGPTQTASVLPLPFSVLPRGSEPAAAEATNSKGEPTPAPSHSALGFAAVPQPAAPAAPAPAARASAAMSLPTRALAAATPAEPAPIATPAAPTVAPTANPAAAASVASLSTNAAPAAAPAKLPVRTGWMIQVGAYPEESDAKQQLNSVKSKAARLLAAADPFTETVVKGGTTYYRARFAGFDKDQAEAACKYLKRNDVDCMTIKN